MRSRWTAVVAALLASGCSILGSGSAGLNTRCERIAPNVDTTVAIAAGILALASAASDHGNGDDGPTGELAGVGIIFAASAFVGYSQASRCRARESAPPPATSDRFLGARRWQTTMGVGRKETPLLALERAYQRAALVCEGRGLSALSSTPLEPRRPTAITLVYRCH